MTGPETAVLDTAFRCPSNRLRIEHVSSHACLLAAGRLCKSLGTESPAQVSCSSEGSCSARTDRLRMIMQVVMRLLMDKGEAMLCEEYTYPHIAESMVQPQGYAAIPLAMDAEGIIPCTFRTTLQSLRDAGKPLPKLLYTIPVGQNPTGQPLEPQDLASDFTGFLCSQFVQHAEQQCA